MLGGPEGESMYILNSQIFKILEDFAYKSTQAKENENGDSETHSHLFCWEETNWYIILIC